MKTYYLTYWLVIHYYSYRFLGHEKHPLLLETCPLTITVLVSFRFINVPCSYLGPLACFCRLGSWNGSLQELYPRLFSIPLSFAGFLVLECWLLYCSWLIFALFSFGAPFTLSSVSNAFLFITLTLSCLYITTQYRNSMGYLLTWIKVGMDYSWIIVQISLHFRLMIIWCISVVR